MTLCVLVHIRIKGEVGAVKLETVLLLWIICVMYVMCLPCFRVCSSMPFGHLLGKS